MLKMYCMRKHNNYTGMTKTKSHFLSLYLTNKIPFLDVYVDINQGWSRDQIP